MQHAVSALRNFSLWGKSKLRNSFFGDLLQVYKMFSNIFGLFVKVDIFVLFTKYLMTLQYSTKGFGLSTSYKNRFHSAYCMLYIAISFAPVQRSIDVLQTFSRVWQH